MAESVADPMDFACSASFAINFQITTGCTIALRDNADIEVPINQDRIEFTKIFMYTIGHTPNEAEADFGLDLSAVGHGVVEIQYGFTPTAPHIDSSVPEPKFGSVRVIATLNRLAATTLYPHISKLETQLTITLNTGLPD